MSMLIRKLFIAATAAAGLAAAMPAHAADLDYGPPRGPSPYDDPRYSDIYRHPAPTQAPRYSAPYYPPAPVYRDERHSPPPYRQQGQFAGECRPQHVIRERLERRGWGDFHDPQPDGNVVHIRARRPSGRLFDLTVDRCTGEVIGAEAIDHRAAQAPLPPPDWQYRDRNYRY